jgi:SAM-dependent methyltransferase
MTESSSTIERLRHLAGRPGHDEVKADFRELLIAEFGVPLDALEFERRVPEVRGRLDALIGRTVFEAKSDLDREWADVERRMPDYLADREREEGDRFIGIASDGRKWAVFELRDGALAVVRRTELDPERAGEFLAWLDGAVALKSSLPPDPLTIRAELGQLSVAYHRVDTALNDLWRGLRHDPNIVLKRQLWAELLTQVYGRDMDNDRLWFQHTFLTIVAKSIALAVMGLHEDDPARLLSGEAFADAGLAGAVESDFFDWVVAGPDGVALVRRIMAHVRRFRLREVESDVLKVLYESLIDRDERHGLGEYYTPDWLARKIVREAVTSPMEQRVLDPACGSGTFLFHAIRQYLAEAEDGGMEPSRRAAEACAQIAGMDIHPVAVIIARVTYLLALAPALSARTGAISVPVYLGDAMQLSISQFMTGKELIIRVPPPPAGDGKSGETDKNGREQLDFPETFCRDPALFDKAIERMRTGSLEGLSRAQIEHALYRITEQHYRADVTHEQQCAIDDLGKTYLVFDKLRREQRDTIWAYVARNLSRPLAFSAAGGWANVLIGNPPWVALRHMSTDLQDRFRGLARDEKVYVGGKFATQNDLAALFTVRAASLYLRSAGKLAFVLPLAVLSRGQFEPLRKGRFVSLNIAWDDVWTMDDSVQPLFPVPACAVFGRRRATQKALPETVRAYTGSLPFRDAPEAVADKWLTENRSASAVTVGQFEGGSPYRKSFRQGATLVPRMLCLVNRRPVSPRLGVDPTNPPIESRRSNQEKRPWKDLPGIESNVEAEFLRPVLLGESILPYRVFRPFEGVIPVTPQGQLLDAAKATDKGYIGLPRWMRRAEALWNEHSNGRGMTLTEQFDYYGKLISQFPIPPLRVVYAASGTLPAACLVKDNSAVIEHILYWAVPATEPEARYLCAVLNSETARAHAEKYQSRGQFGARHFDKVLFNLPIPAFDSKNRLHRDLAAAAAKAEACAARVNLPETVKFQQARRLIRTELTEAGIAKTIDRLVETLLLGS